MVDRTKVTSAVAVLGAMMLTSASFAQESLKVRLDRMAALQGQIAELQTQVVSAPDDRKIFRTLLDAGLQYYELLGKRSKFPDAVRDEILDLMLVMNDMYSIQRTVAEMGPPIGIDGDELALRLASKKVPLAHRRLVPLVDPWGTPYRFFVNRNGQFKIVCAGRGKKFDAADLGISDIELMLGPEIRNASLDDDIVFIDGRNFTRIFDYPKEAQAFLYTLCEPADELRPERLRCW